MLMSMVAHPIYTADYAPLDTIALDDADSDSEKHQPKAITHLHADGVRTVNQALNCKKRQLTTTVDLARFRHTFALGTLTTIDASRNYLKSEDLYTVLKHAPVLKSANLGFNQITQLKHIPTHEALETLLLNDNQIAELNVGNLLIR